MDLCMTWKTWLLLITYHVMCHVVCINGQGPYCYSCDKIGRAQDCGKIVQCAENEMCFSQRLIGSNVHEFYKLGCTDRDLCHKEAFSLFGASIFAGKKREVPPAHALSSRQATDEMLLCYQCCDGKECNNNLCGANLDSTNLRRCFHCDKVENPTDCDTIVECGHDHLCYVHRGPNDITFAYRYDMGCMPSRQCTAAAHVYQNTGCMVCCNDKDYCNFNACDNYTAPVTTTSSTTVTVTQTTATTETTTVTTPSPPTPNITITPDIVQPAQYGYPVTAQCSSDPGVKLKWGFNATESLPEGVRTDGHGNLTILTLNETNAGVYSCVAISPSGTLSTKDIEVKIEETPGIALFIQRTPSGSLTTGTMFELACNVIGYPAPTITWGHINRNGVQSIPGDLTFSNNDLVLTVSRYNATHHDGTWTCTATNKFGNTSAFAHLP